MRKTHLLGTAASTLLAAGLMWVPATAASASPDAPATPTSHPTHRLCAQPTRVGVMACLALARTDVVHHHGLQPTATVAGYGPSDLQSAYNLPSASAGSGQTVALVDAYDDPNAESDLSTYRAQYGLPACTTANGCFRKVDENGGTNYPSPPPASDDWTGEESLDFDMVSAICPQCHILLVEASQPSTADLGTGVNTAVALGAKYVSNSYGGSESSSDPQFDTSYYNHPGVAVTASSGDGGYGVEYPAASRYVTAVGGTTLSRAGNTRGWSESAWSGAGSGCSSYDAKPSFQTDPGCGNRTVADVSAEADPNTGVAVYDSYGSNGGWNVYGGTSASSPIIASTYALAGQPAASSSPNSFPYAHTANLNDVTSGSNGSCGSYLCTAGPGYDGPTGLGTPNGVGAFGGSGGGGGGGTVNVTNPGNQTGTVGTAVSLQIHATDSDGGSLTYHATGLPSGLSINAASGLISGTPTTAATSNVTVTATDSTGPTGQTSFSWTINPAGGGGGCTPAQLLGNPGFETGSAAPWTASSGVISSTADGAPAHSGNYYAWLDGYGTTHTDTLAQTVTIPAGCRSATLSFWVYIDTSESGSTPYDTLKVQAGSTTLATYSNANATDSYVHKSLNLGSYVGRTVTLKFVGHEDSSLQTSFLIDDTAANVS